MTNKIRLAPLAYVYVLALYALVVFCFCSIPHTVKAVFTPGANISASSAPPESLNSDTNMSSKYPKAPDGTVIVDDNPNHKETSDDLPTKIQDWATSIRWQDWLIIGGAVGLILLGIDRGIRAILRKRKKTP